MLRQALGRPIRIAVVGAKGSGKTDLSQHLKDLRQSIPSSLEYQISDLSSWDPLKMAHAYDVMLVLIDISVPTSKKQNSSDLVFDLNAIREQCQKAKEINQALHCLLIGTKSDLKSHIPAERLQTCVKESNGAIDGCCITSVKDKVRDFIGVGFLGLMSQIEKPFKPAFGGSSSLILLKTAINKQFGYAGVYTKQLTGQNKQRTKLIEKIFEDINNFANPVTYEKLQQKLIDAGKAAQWDHEQSSGSRWFFCGPLFHSKCRFQKSVDEILQAVKCAQPTLKV